MIQLNIDRLKAGLSQAINNEDLVEAIVEAAELLNSGGHETPEELARAVLDHVKETEPDLKWPGGFLTKNKTLKIIVECAVKAEEENLSPPSEEPLKPEAAKPSAAPDSILVILPKKISSYGGGFWDSEQQLYILGDKPMTVKRTTFVMSKIANGELIEVKG